MSKIAIYPGSFDPITNGHLYVIEKAHLVFDEIIVGIAKNKSKSALFTLEEKVQMAKEATKNLPYVKIEVIDGLLVDFLKKKKISAIVRGLRAVSDFDYEFQICTVNRKFYPKAETFFIMTSEKYFFLSSSMLKELVTFGADVSDLVPKGVYKIMRAKLKK